MTFISNGSILSVVDNTGVSRINVINFYDNSPGRLGSIFIGSLKRVKPHRRFRRGQLFRSYVIQSRFPVFRPFGSYVRSLSFRTILVKRNEPVPLANRMSTFYFTELKFSGQVKVSIISIYNFLL